MTVWTSRGVGHYAASEGEYAVQRSDLTITKPGIVWCHGHGADHTQGYAESYTAHVARGLAEAGYLYYAIDAGGTATWGNDASQTQVTNARSRLQGALGAKAGKVGVMAFSMGALTVLNWARANASSVACVAVVCPVVDLDYEHDNNVNGYAASIETAYTNLAGFDAAVATHDPMLNTATHAAGPPIKVWYASDDAVAVTARQEAFIAAAGCQSQSLGAVGHSPVSVNAGQVAEFFGGLL